MKYHLTSRRANRMLHVACRPSDISSPNRHFVMRSRYDYWPINMDRHGNSMHPHPQHRTRSVISQIDYLKSTFKHLDAGSLWTDFMVYIMTVTLLLILYVYFSL